MPGGESYAGFVLMCPVLRNGATAAMVAPEAQSRARLGSQSGEQVRKRERQEATCPGRGLDPGRKGT